MYRIPKRPLALSFLIAALCASSNRAATIEITSAQTGLSKSFDGRVKTKQFGPISLPIHVDGSFPPEGVISIVCSGRLFDETRGIPRRSKGVKVQLAGEVLSAVDGTTLERLKKRRTKTDQNGDFRLEFPIASRSHFYAVISGQMKKKKTIGGGLACTAALKDAPATYSPPASLSPKAAGPGYSEIPGRENFGSQGIERVERYSEIAGRASNPEQNGEELSLPTLTVTTPFGGDGAASLEMDGSSRISIKIENQKGRKLRFSTVLKHPDGHFVNIVQPLNATLDENGCAELFIDDALAQWVTDLVRERGYTTLEVIAFPERVSSEENPFLSAMALVWRKR